MNKVRDFIEEMQRLDDSPRGPPGVEPTWARRPPLIMEPSPAENLT